MIKKVIAIFGSHLWLFPWWLSCFVLPLQVRLLLKYRADPTIENNTYKTPLHLACEFGRYKVSTSTATYQIDQYNGLFLYYLLLLFCIILGGIQIKREDIILVLYFIFIYILQFCAMAFTV